MVSVKYASILVCAFIAVSLLTVATAEDDPNSAVPGVLDLGEWLDPNIINAAGQTDAADVLFRTHIRSSMPLQPQCMRGHGIFKMLQKCYAKDHDMFSEICLVDGVIL
jgi:hypothetical protein